jgi:iron complex outermembrane receptor protein
MKKLLIPGSFWLAVTAAAQEPTAVIPLEPEAETAPLASTDEGLQLEEVVVTARRKTERALDVPISLAVLDGDALASAGLTRANDLQERVPGLLVSTPNPRLTIYTIRGLGSSSANDGLESSVGLFLDGVYLGRQGLSIFDLVDLDRVEVLRGPQGTLFGKNTTAGAISIVTKAPTPEFEANLEGSLGNFDYRQARGSVNGALIGDALSGRLTGYVTEREGLITNRYNGDKLNERSSQGLRGQLLLDTHQSWTARLIAEYGKTDGRCCVYPLVGPVREAVSARDDYMEYLRASTDPFDREADSDGRTNIDMKQKAVSVELNWDIGDAHRLTSISAWRDWTFYPYNDDAMSLDVVPQTGTANAHEQISQEIRLASNFDRFDSVLGLYYLRQDFDSLDRTVLGEDAFRWAIGGVVRENVPGATYSNTGFVLDALVPPESIDGMTSYTQARQISDSAAAFGSIDWHLTPSVDLTTGLRYTYEWKRASVVRYRVGGNPQLSPLYYADPPLSAINQLLGIDLTGVGFNGLIENIAPGDVPERRDRRREGNPSGQLALSWKFARDALSYASVARGYKSGGINLGVTGESVSPTFKPELATAYEIGAKGQLFDRRLSLSFALYQTDIDDYQALTFDNEPTILPNPRQSNLLNVGKVRLRGAELEGNGYLFSGLMLRGGVAYSDAVTTDFKNAPNEETRANDKDLSGERLYNAPRWSGNLGTDYRYKLGRHELYGNLDWFYRSTHYATVERGRASRIDSYSLTNLRIGFRPESQRWDIALWTRNLFDEDYVAAVHPLYGVGDYGAVAGDPRTYGATLRANFY